MPTCPKCKGTGESPYSKNGVNYEPGSSHRRMMALLADIFEEKCPECGGTGEIEEVDDGGGYSI